jgi:Zn-dependent protease
MFGSLDSATLIARAIVLVIAFSVHEFAHAFTADYFGDMTPRQQGRLTLNPLKHLDPIGSLLLLATGFGWARPVIVNPWVLAQASPAAMMWVSLAGPFSNLLLAIVGSIPFWFGLANLAGSSAGFLPTFDHLFTEFVWINLILLFFNLIPIAPLDGEKVAMHLLPPAGKEAMMRIRPYSWMILLLVVFLVPGVLNVLVGMPASFLLNFLVR